MITAAQVTEYEPHRFIAEASSLGHAPGYWPRVLHTNLGNGRPFVQRDFVYDCEDVPLQDRQLVAMVYWQELGCISLKVLND